MLDFKELKKSGVEFEQLVRELLLSEGFEIHWTGVGPDGDKDLIAIESYEGKLGEIQKKWVVQCKHNAHSEKSVGKNDLQIMETCLAIGADGFLIACSTQPSSGLINHLKDINNFTKVSARYWDSIEIERRLMKPHNYHLIDMFFNESAKKLSWKLYNTQDSSFWMAYYKKYFIYLSSRDSLTFSEIGLVEKFIEVIEGFDKIDKRKLVGLERCTNSREYLLPRAVYYDDKNTNFLVFLDYMYYTKEKPKARLVDFDQYFNEKNWNIEGVSVNWDIRFVEANFGSDHFRINHKDYYKNFMDNFKIGYSRDSNEFNRLYEDYDYIEKAIMSSGLVDLLDKYEYKQHFNAFEQNVIDHLKNTHGGTSSIEAVLNYVRGRHEFEKDDRLNSVWQILYIEIIHDLIDEDIIVPFRDSPNGVITLTEKGRQSCDYYESVLRK